MECTKVSFINEDFANQYIKKLKKTSTRTTIPVRAYLCEKCLKWHLTSQPQVIPMQMVYKDREIANLKKKIIHLQNEIERLKEEVRVFNNPNYLTKH